MASLDQRHERLRDARALGYVCLAPAAADANSAEGRSDAHVVHAAKSERVACTHPLAELHCHLSGAPAASGEQARPQAAKMDA